MRCLEGIVREVLEVLRPIQHVDLELALATVSSIISQHYNVPLREVENLVCNLIKEGDEVEISKLKALTILGIDDLLITTSTLG